MLVWIPIVLITVLSLLWLLAPLLRKNEETDVPGGYDVEVYRDQLAEIDRDVSRGLLSESEAQTTRTEISRRLIAAADRDAGSGPARHGRASSLIVASLAVTVAGGAVGLYLWEGSPGLEDKPLAERTDIRPSQEMAERLMREEGSIVDPDLSQIDPRTLEMIEQLRIVLASRPNDLRGLRLLANALARTGDFSQSHRIQTQVIALSGAAATAEDYGQYAEMMILAVNGYVSPEAEQALANALKLEPKQPASRYYAGLAMAQRGDAATAYALWSELLAEGPPEAPWNQAIRSQIAEVAVAAGQPVPPMVELSGPDADDIAAAEDMTAEERQAMIRGMVDGLAEELATSGGPAPKWAQLIRSLGVLGETDRAKAIVAEARTVFAARPQDMATIEAAAADAGVLP